MRYRISSEIFAKYPTYFRVVVFAKKIDNTKSVISELEELLAVQSNSVQKNNPNQLKHPRITKWLSVYNECGINTSQNAPSIYALLSRIQNGKKLSFISPIVAIMNLTSMSYLLPCGGIDQGTVQGDLVLGFSSGGETFLPFGKSERETIPPGEIIYYDSGTRNVICRSWNSKGGQSTKIQKSTSSTVIDLDAFEETTPRNLAFDAAKYMVDLITKYCGGTCTMDLLTSECPELIVSDD